MLKEPLEVHCLGGFVICYFYGLPRTTGDIDYASSANFFFTRADLNRRAGCKTSPGQAVHDL